MCGSSAARTLPALPKPTCATASSTKTLSAAKSPPCFVERDGKRTDIVVLACTHYPFLVNRMRKTAPWPVDWLDPAEAIARRTVALLREQSALSDAGVDRQAVGERADRAVFTSNNPDAAIVRLMHGFGLTYR
jgi:glutamate racemase